MNLGKIKPFVIFAVLFVIVLVSPGCYFWATVDNHEVGLRLPDGVSVQEVVGPGRYSDVAPYSKLVTIDSSVKTFEWTDPDLATKDKQIIGLSIGVSVRRKPDSESVRNMYQTYRSESLDDEALKNLVFNRVPRVAKQVTTQFTLDQMLGVSDDQESSREEVARRISELLLSELEEFNVELVDVGVNNIATSEAYQRSLERKAEAQIEAEIAKEETKRLTQELIKEQKQTEIDIERATRNNKVQEELAKVYAISPEALELEKLRIVSEAIGGNDKMFFVPQGADITFLLSPTNKESNSVIPLPIGE